jgi:hypothetical protein
VIFEKLLDRELCVQEHGCGEETNSDLAEVHTSFILLLANTTKWSDTFLDSLFHF